MNSLQALNKIKKLCELNPYMEVCGFLGYDDKKKSYVVEPKKNISDNPRQYFMLDPVDYILFKDEYSLIAVYHSHIKGNEKPSEFDIKMSENCCDPFLIYSLNNKKVHIYEPQNMDLDVNRLEQVKDKL